MSASAAIRTGRAFAPAHVTGIFSPDLSARDPRGRGSIGAGLVLEAGVVARADWQASDRTSLQVRSDARRPLPITTEVARRLLARRPGRLRVTLRHELPIGQGFGMSAAGAVATALAVASATRDSKPLAIEIAHLADLFGGGGLGGVSAVLGGGMEIRERPGIPPRGRVTYHPAHATVFLIVAGPEMPSPALLRDPKFLRRVHRAAAPGLVRLRQHPSMANLLRESERFTDALRLGPPAVLRRMRELRTAETRVAQAMFGRSLFAVARTSGAKRTLLTRLARLGLRAVEVSLGSQGARILAGDRTRPGEMTLGSEPKSAPPERL